jgi:hypothetical protein
VKKHLFPLLTVIGVAALGGCPSGIEPVPFQGIGGTISFVGDVPDNTDWVRLIVYRSTPQDSADFLGFVAFTDTLPLARTNTPYLLGLEAEEYGWLPLVWKEKDADLSAGSLRVLGWYTAGGGPFDPPASVTVESGKETDEVDLVGDFDNMLTPEEVLELLR